ncbi:MAG: thiol-disulfide oxidoreductase DCC family protein [Opitutales bacterium]
MKEIVLFDGDCGFCQRSIQFIWQHDREGRYQFAPMRSEIGRKLLAERGLSDPDFRTFYLIQGERLLDRSDAALEIASHLDHPSRALKVFRAIPRPLRNLGYAFIAINRHLLPGRKDACEIPPPEVRERFLA